MDPFNEGHVTSANFYGILGIFEYSCSGIEGNSRSKLDITNASQLRYLSQQIQQLKNLYFKYKKSSLLEKQALGKLLKAVDGLDNTAEEIFKLIEVKNQAKFGQFLSIVPFLLENYTKIMQSLE